METVESFTTIMEVGVNVATTVGEVNKLDIQPEITRLRKILYLQAKYYDFNLQHPEIQSLSQKLDELILVAMQEKCTH